MASGYFIGQERSKWATVIWIMWRGTEIRNKWPTEKNLSIYHLPIVNIYIKQAQKRQDKKREPSC